jgi:hypothetical protein
MWKELCGEITRFVMGLQRCGKVVIFPFCPVEKKALGL